MTAHKKTTYKVTKSPTPATKTGKAAKAAAPAVVQAVPPAVTSTAEVTAPASTAPSAPATTAGTAIAAPEVKAPAAASVTAIAAVPAPTRPVTAVASKPVVTTITARINIGFGNSLYLRGEGAGLSWNRGVQMTCMSANEWLITVPESARPVVFKFLINDVTWSTGPDYSVLPGTGTVLTPTF